jgi:hypothetical protein
MLFCVIVFNACNVDDGTHHNNDGGSDVIYNIRDLGPAGGYIFYINPNSATAGWKYLEAAPDNQSTDIQWYNGSNIVTGATGVVYGTGESNTSKIVAAQGVGNYAAKICDDLVLGGFSDWFLPSKDELLLMRNVLYLSGIGGFSSYYYWSSTEGDAETASMMYFTDGFQYNALKSTHQMINVRAVRAF